MAREPRGAVVSVRISDEEQARLRQLADQRGTSVSDLVRSVVTHSMTPQPSARTTVTTSTRHSTAVTEGIFWDAGANTVTAGQTIIVL